MMPGGAMPGGGMQYMGMPLHELLKQDFDED